MLFSLALVLAFLAAAIHVYIFYLESLSWTSPKTRAAFKITAEEAETTKGLAFNQGFYNLFLAVLVIIGLVFLALGSHTIGTTLLLAGMGCMFAASLVLGLSSKELRGAALKQGLIPALGIIVLLLH